MCSRLRIWLDLKVSNVNNCHCWRYTCIREEAREGRREGERRLGREEVREGRG